LVRHFSGGIKGAWERVHTNSVCSCVGVHCTGAGTEEREDSCHFAMDEDTVDLLHYSSMLVAPLFKGWLSGCMFVWGASVTRGSLGMGWVGTGFFDAHRLFKRHVCCGWGMGTRGGFRGA